MPTALDSITKIYQVPQKLSESLWPKLEFFVAKALNFAQGEFLPIDIMQRLVIGEMQAWLIQHNELMKGMAVTELVRYPQLSVLRVVTLTGTELGEWLFEFLDTLEKFARKNGATRIEAVGRKGWVRRLEPLGFTPAYTTVIKEVSPNE